MQILETNYGRGFFRLYTRNHIQNGKSGNSVCAVVYSLSPSTDFSNWSNASVQGADTPIDAIVRAATGVKKS